MSFLHKNKEILLFSMLQVFFSAPGQTFLISLCVTHIFNDLDISLSSFAALYSAATLSASLLLNFAGQMLDIYPLKIVMRVNIIMMAIGCLLLASATHISVLFFGFFILRLFGQGIFGLTASTILGKAFHKNRAKALGIMTLGFPLSEAIYPFLVISFLSIMNWRFLYVTFAASCLILMLPIQNYLLSKMPYKKDKYLPGESLDRQDKGAASTDKTLKYVMKDYKFYLIIIASFVPPVIMTGLFFHQATLFKLNSWPISSLAFGITIYALSKMAGSLSLNAQIDTQGPVKYFAIVILLMSGGTAIAALGGPIYMSYLYLGILGFALGLSGPVMNCVWPNMYGTKHLGSIKGYTGTFRNGFTALGPLPPALAMDAGYDLRQILMVTAISVAGLAILPFIVQKLDPSIKGQHPA
jgi:MFS family permease